MAGLGLQVAWTWIQTMNIDQNMKSYVTSVIFCGSYCDEVLAVTGFHSAGWTRLIVKFFSRDSTGGVIL